MIDIVTVVFEQELDVVQQQAKSIDLYCQDFDIGQIFVVVNDRIELINSINKTWWGSMADRVQIIHRDQWHPSWIDNGWVTQQVCKLLACSTSQADWCMVLDAKTIIVKHLLFDQIFDQHGRVYFGTQPPQEIFLPSMTIANQLFGTENKEMAGPGGVPFFMEPVRVRGLLDYVLETTGKKLADWFQEKGMITEFILYSGWVFKQTGDLKSRYAEFRHLPVNICHSEVELFDMYFEKMQRDNCISVSVHRNAWDRLPTDQKEKYKMFIKQRGIE
jgi:hypothetical protein